MPTTLRRPSAGELADLRAGLRDAPLTYTDVGATAAGVLPGGYHHDRARAELGAGDDVWRRAQEALRTWQAHRGAGATISPDGAPLDPGTVVVATVRVGALFVVAPCRIVYATAEADRFGFGYGTLPGHPEQGEEAFHVSRAADGTVSFEIVVFSRPATALTKLGGPVARLLQKRTTRLYLAGVQAYASGFPAPE